MSILKTSMQLLGIALIGRLVQKKQLRVDTLLALCAVAVGVGVVIWADLVWRGEAVRSTSTLQQAAGTSLPLTKLLALALALALALIEALIEA